MGATTGKATRHRGPARVRLPVRAAQEMFGDVWRWAGTQRQRVTNIGVDPSQIPEETRRALDDAKYWHDNNVLSFDERAARLHYRLVSAHPFPPNGNGRATLAHR